MIAPRSQRPIDLTPLQTHELPFTPPANRVIPAEAWIEAPEALLTLGDDIGEASVIYLRQIGPFLVWRAGAGTSKAPTRWLALDIGDLDRCFSFEQDAEGVGFGIGPSGAEHERFRTWKEDLHTS